MQTFEMELFLPVEPELLKEDLFTMSGVNYELAPMIKMSAPEKWGSKAITQWPVNEEIFTSTISLFGVIPIDRHRFKLLSINSSGFIESSSSLFNSVWSHERTITKNGSGANVKDVVGYKNKIGLLGSLLKPVYRSIFTHRHKRLKLKYAKIS
ncbi:hypothetical protein [Marinomonas transparens]|uniref:Uncharacterized protein n=1 Tax=Marinomonas transparens TaxID=2795388 RepID=A0A934N0B9_9GAMM|nr:hypothetical protein [Marinomonas transparens]MBJ7536557.1 hypothetical protein [Marinomonas transparens]